MLAVAEYGTLAPYLTTYVCPLLFTKPFDDVNDDVNVLIPVPFVKVNVCVFLV